MKTLVLWVDAFRRDYLNRKDTPFLYSLSQAFGVGELKPVFGYSSIGASFYTGVYPDKHDQLAIYCRDGQPINDWILNYLPLKMGTIYFNLRRYFRHEDNFVPLIQYAYGKQFCLSQNKFYHHPGALKVQTIFDICRATGKAYLLYNWPLINRNGKTGLTFNLRPDDNQRTKIFLDVCRQPYDLCFMHLWDLDRYGHHYGPGTGALKPKIREQDDLARQIVSQFSLDNDNIIIWSDHGMLEVETSLDLPSRLPLFGDGYLYFLDSTMARFWFFNEQKRNEVLTILNGMEKGHILTDEEKKEFHINFPHNKSGDEIFLVNPGVQLAPNFFQKHTVKGMHGYDLTDKKEWGIFLMNRCCRVTGETVDLMPTILEMMKIDCPEMDGSHLLQNSR